MDHQTHKTRLGYILIVSSANFANVSGNGNANYNNASNSNGVRPGFSKPALWAKFPSRPMEKEDMPILPKDR